MTPKFYRLLTAILIALLITLLLLFAIHVVLTISELIMIELVAITTLSCFVATTFIIYFLLGD